MPRSVTVEAGQHVIQLPDGLPHEGGATVVLTDEQWALISPTAVSSGLVVDNGAVDATDLVSVQGAAVTAPTALTSAAATGGDAPTEAEYNALRTDVNNLRTTVANLRTSLTGAGKPLSS